MSFRRQTLARTVFATVAMLCTYGLAAAQNDSPRPELLPKQPTTTLPDFPADLDVPIPDLPPGVAKTRPATAKQSTLPPLDEPAPLKEPLAAPVPAPEKAPVGKQQITTLPVNGDVNVKDLILTTTEGPSAANPTGRQEPGISMEWLYPATVRIHQPVTCTLIVRSISINRLHQVVVRTRIPYGVTVKGADPKAATEGEVLVWNLGNLEPRQEKRIDIHLLPTVRGSLPCQAFVTFTGSSMAKIEVREPKLALKAIAQNKIILGDLAVVALTVSNPGDAKTEHIRVKVNLTDGLAYGTGKGTEFLLDNLGPNESRTVLLQCAAKLPGAQVCSVTATAEAGLEAHCSSNIDILAPRVDVVVSGPKMRYLDRHGVYSLKVTNPGTATANHVTLNSQVPQGFKFVSATAGGYHDFATRTVVWFLGDLKPGQSKEVQLDLLAVNPGEYRNQVTVSAARGLRSAAEILTRLEGLPGLLMEVVDVEDPVEVGKELSYEIRMTNTGTKTETNLQLACTMTAEMEFVGAKSTAGIPFRVEGREIIFTAIPRLAPRADVIFRVNVRCTAPGDQRFRVRVRADGLETPVLQEESTRVFGDDRQTPAVPGKR